MPDELGRYCAALRDEKRALVDRLLQAREDIKKLAEELLKIEEKFKVPVKIYIYRSSLVSRYSRRERRIEYRVWAHSNKPNAYPREVLEDWMDKLIVLRPPIQPALYYIITDESNWGYEGDRVISPEDIAPPDARMDTVYGHAVYDTWQYLFEQSGKDLIEISAGSAPSEVRIRLKHFGIEVTEEELRRGRRLRHRAT